jgi:hypothetical protein
LCPATLSSTICSVSTASDLRERLLELGNRLDVLLERRERASRAHSFADARQSAGVTHDDADKMAEYAQDEEAGDTEITGIRREIRSVDDELERAHQARGLRARANRILRLRHH